MTHKARDYEVRIWWSPRDEAYIATCAEFPYISGVGDTRDEAAREIHFALETALKASREENLPIPTPLPHSEHIAA